MTAGVARQTAMLLEGATESSNRAVRAPIWLVEAAEVIGTDPLVKAAVGPARTPSVALLAVLQVRSTAAMAAAALQELLLRVLMVDLLEKRLGENTYVDVAAEMTLTA